MPVFTGFPGDACVTSYGSVFDVSLLSVSLAAVDVVLGAEELRYAAQAIGKISGFIDVEDILDVVFKDFCIGK